MLNTETQAPLTAKGLRIVLLSHVKRDWSGGAACCTLELAKAWRELGASVTDVYRDELIVVRAGRLSVEAMSLAMAARAFSIAQQADIVVGTGPIPWALFERLRRTRTSRGYPLLVSYTYGLEHIDYDAQREEASRGTGRLSASARARWRLLLRPAVERSIISSDTFIVPTRTQARVAESRGWIPGSRILAIGHGVASEAFIVNRTDQPWTGRVAWCGTLVDRKGWRYARDGFIAAARILPNLRLDVFGSRTGAQAIHAQFPADVAARVEVVPVLARREQFSRLARADIFLSASLSEGYHLALQEALALGIPSIATDDGFMADLAVGDRPVVQVAKRSTSDVANAIVSLAGDPLLRSRLNRLGKAWAASRNWQQLGDKTLSWLVDQRSALSRDIRV